MKYILITLFVFFTAISFSSAQSVIVNEDNVITRMMFRMTQLNQTKGTVEGWRIQILATTDRRKLEDEKRKFQSQYPQYGVDWTHEKPYYKLKAGAFSTKLEAARLLHILKKDYPSAYPAKDNNINPRELLGI